MIAHPEAREDGRIGALALNASGHVIVTDGGTNINVSAQGSTLTKMSNSIYNHTLSISEPNGTVMMGYDGSVVRALKSTSNGTLQVAIVSDSTSSGGGGGGGGGTEFSVSQAFTTGDKGTLFLGIRQTSFDEMEQVMAIIYLYLLMILVN